MLRIIPTAAHTLEDVQFTLDAFSAVSEKLAKGIYRQGMSTVAPETIEISAESASE
jgi:glycine C-acetyltransferase